MPKLDLGTILVEGGAGVVGGGVQRLAWEASQMVGMFTTGGLILGGMAVEMMVDQPMLRQVGRAATISGATVAGWVAAEKFIMPAGPTRLLGQLGGKEQRALQEAEARRRATVGARSGLDGARNAFAMVDEWDKDRTVL